jgi:hypothetical protein
MVCKTYDQLWRDYKVAQNEWAYFTYPQNKELRRTSDRKSKQFATVAMERMSKIRQQMDAHSLGCEDCKAASEASHMGNR